MMMKSRCMVAAVLFMALLALSSVASLTHAAAEHAEALQSLEVEEQQLQNLLWQLEAAQEVDQMEDDAEATHTTAAFAAEDEMETLVEVASESVLADNNDDTKEEHMHEAIEAEAYDEDDTSLLETSSEAAPLPRPSVTDFGIKSTLQLKITFQSGWYDALGRGYSNDYCRYVGHHRKPFLSCALAGGRSQYSAPGRFRPKQGGGVERNPCFQVNCGTHGTCNAKSGLCSCSHGFSGVECEIPSDDCKGIRCSAHGKCVSGFCQCQRGWFGASCEKNRCNDLKVNCGEHGVCFDGKCHCAPHYTGEHCQFKARQTSNSLFDWGMENIKASEGTIGPVIASGWFDVQAQSGVDAAHPHVLNDYCRWVGYDPSYFSCALAGSTEQYTPPGMYIWDTDSKKPKLNKCFNINCGKNGECVQATGTCRCHGDWQGARCEITPDQHKCAAINCGKNGYCDQGKCLCKENWSGARCEIDPCSTLKCGAHGQCSNGHCACAGNFEGPQCQYRKKQALIRDKGFRGVWVDAQNQGKANDYCRVIGGGKHGGVAFVSCALAGSASPYTPPGAFRFNRKDGKFTGVTYHAVDGFDLHVAITSDKYAEYQHGTLSNSGAALVDLQSEMRFGTGFKWNTAYNNISFSTNACGTYSVTKCGVAATATNLVRLMQTSPASSTSLQTIDTYTSGTVLRRGFCMANDYDNAPPSTFICRCYGGSPGADAMGGSFNYGPWGGSFCETAPCLLDPHNTVTTFDPQVSANPLLSASTPITIQASYLTTNSGRLTYAIPYNGTQSVNFDFLSGASNNFAMPSNITYKCRPGYHVSGSAATTTSLTYSCSNRKTSATTDPAPFNVNANTLVGQWDSSIPFGSVCVAVTCPAFVITDAHLSVSYSNTQNYQSVATFSCGSGYSASSSATSTCQVDGTWSVAAPTCNAAGCPAIGSDAHGTFSPLTANTGGTSTLTCNAGYYTNLATATCMADQTWQGVGTTVLCQPVSCTLASPIANGTVTGANGQYTCTAAYGASLTIQCNAGYQLSTGTATATLTCQQTAPQSSQSQWSSAVPTCVPSACASPFSPPANGLVNGGTASVNGVTGTVVSVTCQNGYSPSSTSAITASCNATGVWTYSSPLTCSSVACDDINTDLGTGVRVSSRSGVTNTVITYTCANAGYQFSGVSQQKCMNKVWTNITGDVTKAPTCTPLQCPAAPTYTDVISSATTVGYGQSVFFSCAPGYNLVGSQFISCSIDSNGNLVWTTPTTVPKCWCSFYIGSPNGDPIRNITHGGSQQILITPYAPVATDVIVSVSVTGPGDLTLGTGTSSFLQIAESVGAEEGAMATSLTLTFPASATQTPAIFTYTVPLSTTATISNIVFTVTQNTAPLLAPPANLPILIGSLNGRCSIAANTLRYDGDVTTIATPIASSLDLSNQDGGPFGFVTSTKEICANKCSSVFACKEAIWEISTGKCYLFSQIFTTVVSSSSYSSATCLSGCQKQTPPDGSHVIISGPNWDPNNLPYGVTFPVEGQQVWYNCDQNYYQEGNWASTCQTDGTWSAAYPTCKPTPCSTLTPVAPLQVNATTGVYGDVVTFSCSAGYQLTNSAASFQCGLTQTLAAPNRFYWSNTGLDGTGYTSDAPYPTCSPQSCPDVSDIQYGSKTGPGTVNSLMIFSCDDTYQLVGNPAISCGTDRNWNTTDRPVCLKKCATVTAPTFGTINPGTRDYIAGQTFNVSCNPGYVLSQNMPYMLVTCLPTGVLSPAGPSYTCSALSCPTLAVADSKVQVAGFVSGAVTGAAVQFNCPVGYNLQGATSSNCIPDSATASRWSDAAPTCAAQPCSSLVVPAYAVGAPYAGVTDQSVTVECLAGYAAVPSTPITCLANGTWSTPNPVCQPKPCPALTAPANGAVSATTGNTGDFVTYSCNSGYYMTGAAVSSCQNTGVWSSLAPTCTIQSCPPLSAVTNSNMSTQAPTGLVVGASVTVACNAGYQMSGSATMNCLATDSGAFGFWNPPTQPTCSAISCGFLNAPGNGSVNNAGTASGSFGDSATFACNDGFTLSSNPYLTCSIDSADSQVKWLPVQIPTCVDQCDGVNCGSNGACQRGSCVCTNGYTGSQCQIAPVSYYWNTTDYSACSVACGEGIKTRSVVCLGTDKNVYTDDKCISNTTPKPLTSDICNTQACVVKSWTTPNFGTCSVSCGGGTQTRSVVCQGDDNNVYPDTDCTGNKPLTIQACGSDVCITYAWQAGEFGSCSKSCGNGTQTRTVVCLGSNGVNAADSQCDVSTKPSATQNCYLQACVGYSWQASDFGTCSTTCGSGVQTRTVTCAGTDNSINNPDSYCNQQNGGTATKPASSQTCNTQACPTFSWVLGAFSDCSKTCGGGVSTRNVTCVGSDQTLPGDSGCAAPKPATTQDCNTQRCVVYSWSQSGWSDCSADCGGGQQTQTVTCAGDDDTVNNNVALCANAGAQPATSQSCNTQRCITFSWSNGAWGVCNQTCALPGTTSGYASRSVTCLSSENIIAADSVCLLKVEGPKPDTIEPCNSQACVPGKWISEAFSACSKPCADASGPGTQSREVVCEPTEDDRNCTLAGAMPVSSQTCNTDICVTYSWQIQSTWGACSTSCGGGVSTQSVQCIGSDSKTYPDAMCPADYKPPTSMPCNTDVCVTFGWKVSDFRTCDQPCGGGNQYRDVVCWASNNTVASSEDLCNAGNVTKPALSQPCNTFVCLVYSWKTATNWTDCSKSCGTGSRTRTVQCVTQFDAIVEDVLCGNLTRPNSVEDCNTDLCITYSWSTSQYGACSTTCGGGVSTRDVSCIGDNGVDHAIAADDSKCTSQVSPKLDDKPGSSIACNTFECMTYSWQVLGDWSACSKSCGSGSQTQTVQCQNQHGVVVENVLCDASSQPASTQTCNTNLCVTYSWATGTFGTCSATCGGGVSTRDVNCIGDNGVDHAIAAEDADCTSQVLPKLGPKPNNTVACNTFECMTYSWKVLGDWSACSKTCGTGSQTQTVQCQDQHGVVVQNVLCDASSQPASAQACNTDLCVTYSWSTADFGACSATCGGGVATRTVTCIGDNGVDHAIAAEDASCTSQTTPKLSDKPATSQACNTQKCVVYQWQPSEWSTCSKTCATGTQTRDIKCIGDDGSFPPATLCSGLAQPLLQQDCNTQACISGSWNVGPWSNCTVNCGSGQRTRTVDCAPTTDDTDCSAAGSKPTTQETCNTQVCVTYSWVVTTPFGACSTSCGGGVQTQTVVCRGSDSNDYADGFCDASSKPSTSQTCNTQICLTYAFNTTDFGTCSKTCGGGVMTRDVFCVASPTNVKVDDSNCLVGDNAVKPATSLPCNEQVCDTYGWVITTPFGLCTKPCGSGVQTQTVECQNQKQVTVADVLCDSTKKPAVSQDCNTQICLTYAFNTTDFSSCSKTCGGGVMTRDVFCVASPTDVKVADDNCYSVDGVVKPASSLPCNEQVCQVYSWNITTPFGLCTKPCGGGVQTQEVQCQNQFGVQKEDVLCDNSTKPATSQDCNTQVCLTYAFNTTDFGACDQTCGGGVMTRDVFCVASPTNVKVADDNCYSVDGVVKPVSSVSCNEQECFTYSWVVVSPWSDCSRSCGTGTSSQAVECQNQHNVTVSELLCDASAKPATLKYCNTDICVTYSWNVSDYGSCSRNCGGGVSTRTVTCVGSDNSVNNPDDKCLATSAKPASSIPCNETPCVTYSWVTSQFSPCNATCGSTGRETRVVRCEGSDQTFPDDSACANSGDKPVDIQTCNTQDCIPGKWDIGAWSDCDQSCGPNGQQRRTVHCIETADDITCAMAGPEPIAVQSCNTNITCVTYAWDLSQPYSNCSLNCDGGVSTRVVNCLGSDNKTYADDYCMTDAGKPQTSQVCNTQPCRYSVWAADPFGDCSTTCGSGVQTRVVRCESCLANQTSCQFIEDAPCAAVDPNKPASSQACNTQKCVVYDWSTPTDWSECSASCNTGNQTRTQVCMGDNGIPAANSSLCTKPHDSWFQPCNTQLCVSWKWVIGDWQSCSLTCGEGVQTRSVQCMGSDNQPYEDIFCSVGSDAGAKPATSQPCNTQVCVTYSWVVGDYCPCSLGCGGGVAGRSVNCRAMPSGLYVDDSYCANAGAKPESSSACNTDPCLTYSWKTLSDWSDCPVLCGGGTQSRIVQCWSSANQNVSESFCPASERPPSTQACNSSPCETFGWVPQPWGKCSKECGGTGTATRSVLCVSNTGRTVSDSNCADRPKPPTEGPCNTHVCGSYHWYPCSWGQCSAACGGGVHTRTISCMSNNGTLVDNSVCAQFSAQPATQDSCNVFSCDQVAASIRICLDMELQCMPPEELKRQFRFDVSAAAGITQNRIIVNSIRASYYRGPEQPSTSVNFTILPSKDSNAKSVATVVANLEKQAVDPWSKLHRGLLTHSHDIDCKLRWRYFPPCSDGTYSTNCTAARPGPKIADVSLDQIPESHLSQVHKIVRMLNEVDYPTYNPTNSPMQSYPLVHDLMKDLGRVSRSYPENLPRRGINYHVTEYKPNTPHSLSCDGHRCKPKRTYVVADVVDRSAAAAATSASAMRFATKSHTGELEPHDLSRSSLARGAPAATITIGGTNTFQHKITTDAAPESARAQSLLAAEEARIEAEMQQEAAYSEGMAELVDNVKDNKGFL